MPVSKSERALLMQSFDKALSEELAMQPSRFYELLFEQDPGLRRMFRDDLVGQGMKFMSVLKSIIVTLGDPAAIKAELEPLGQSHAALGVTSASFEPMGEALIETLRELLGSDFNPQLEAIWRTAYSEISTEMIDHGQID